MAQAATAQKLVTVREFALQLGLKEKSVRQKLWRRELPYVKVGRNVRLRADLIDELITRGTVPARRER